LIVSKVFKTIQTAPRIHLITQRLFLYFLITCTNDAGLCKIGCTDH